MTFGYVGAGKTTVARWLSPRCGAVHLRADGIRYAMFEGDRPDLYSPENKALVNNAVYYAAKQVLKAGYSVIYDANNNSRATRKKIEALAHTYGAIPVVVWVQVSEDVAKERIQTRAQNEGHVIFDPNIIENMRKTTDVPDAAQERLITLDGLATAEEQQASFDAQLAALR